MQILADVLNVPIKVVRSENASALGAAMYAAVVSGIYINVQEAQKKMSSGFDSCFNPHPVNVQIYKSLYKKYLKLGNFIEEQNRH